MKTTKIITLIITLLLTATSFAGDGSTYQSLGFSKDGKYFAFLQDGEEDGSGFYYVSADVIETQTNKLIKRESIVGDEIEYVYEDDAYWSNPEVRKAHQDKVKKELFKRLDFEKYGLDKPVFGKTLISRNQYDKSEYTSTGFTFNEWPMGGTSASHQTYSLTLNTPSAPQESVADYCWDTFDVKMVDLKLIKNPNYQDEKEVLTLQQDTRLPASRNCTFKYWIVGVESLNDTYISVILRYSTLGFEGPNERVMAVTAKIN